MKLGALGKWWLKNLLFLFLSGAVLFLLAGGTDWPLAWAYLGAILLTVFTNAAVVDPSLLAERSELQAGTKKWDVILSVFVAILGPLLTLAVAGLDRRWGLFPFSWLPVQIPALFLFLLGALLGAWAMGVNKFFSATVRIQEERHHQVVTAGPYRWLRHPGYLAGIISNLMAPLILGSRLGLIPALLVAGGYVLRTVLEDQVLQEELTGYSEYGRKVSYLLFPGVW